MAKERKRIGPYRVLKAVGSGGMGVVWHAIHEPLQREVAIKELTADGAKERESIERFRREGMALAQLKHESIVGIHDLFIASDRLFMVLEYVDGVVLYSLIKSGRLPWDVTAILGMRLASALEHAHYHKVIHRDLKPGNIMISKTGEVKLMDFGIARDQLLEDLTRAGFAVGTPAYMPPEIISGSKANAQSDIYSLGVTLYECLAGEHPFLDADPSRTFKLVMAGKYKPLRKYRRDLPAKFASLVDRCMKIDPAKRYPTAAVVRREFELMLIGAGARANHRQRLVEHLKAANRITDTEANTCINADDLVETAFLRVETNRKRTLRLAATVAAISVGAASAWWLLQEQVFGFLQP